jgi:DNA primase
VLDAGFAIVCEGQLDLIACYMAGVQNIVAPQGTAFTDNHARILKRYVDEVVLCFDSDNAGQNAAVRSLDSLLASGMAVRVAVVPAPHDPDSFIKQSGAEAFKKLVEGADGFFDYYLNRLCATNEIATDKGQLAVLHGMAEAVQKTGNGVLVDKYAQKTALRLGVTPDAVRAEFKKSPKAANTPGDAEDAPFETAATSEIPRPSPLEYWLVKLLLMHEDLLGWAALHLDPQWIQHPLVRRIIEQRLAAHAQETWQSLAAFLEQFEADAKSLITEAVTEERGIPNPAQQLADVVLKFRNQSLDRQLAALTLQLNQPQASGETHLHLLRQQQELRQLKRQPLAPLADDH